MKPSDECISDFVLDRLIAADSTAEQERQCRAHLATCSRCAGRLRQLDAERVEFLERGPRLSWPKAKARDRGVGRLRSLRRPFSLALASAAVLLFVVGRGSLWGNADEATRTKGGVSFELYIRHAEQTRRATDHDSVFAGDQLQLAYSAAQAGYVVLLSRDGAGVVSAYFPSAGSQAWPAPPGAEQLLPESTLLDATLGEEHVHALHCRQRLDIEPLLRALAGEGIFEAPEGCRMRTIVLEKQAQP